MFGQKSRQQDKAVSELIEEQRQKESVDVYRRAWCISEATYVLDDCAPETLIKMAKEIYLYVYGEESK